MRMCHAMCLREEADGMGRRRLEAVVFIALVSLALALLAYRQDSISTVMSMTSSAEGTIEQVAEYRPLVPTPGRNPNRYGFSVRFTDEGGRERLSKSICDADLPVHQEGERITVLYNAEDPERGCIVKGEERIARRGADRGLAFAGGLAAAGIGYVIVSEVGHEVRVRAAACRRAGLDATGGGQMDESAEDPMGIDAAALDFVAGGEDGLPLPQSNASFVNDVTR